MQFLVKLFRYSVLVACQQKLRQTLENDGDKLKSGRCPMFL